MLSRADWSVLGGNEAVMEVAYEKDLERKFFVQ